MDFVVLDTEPVHNASSQIPIIFGRPLLATIEATIKVRSGIMTLVFGNMTLNVKIFSNHRADDCREEDKETICVEAASQEEVSSLCSRDFVEEVISNSCYLIESYTPREEETRKTCYLVGRERWGII